MKIINQNEIEDFYNSNYQKLILNKTTNIYHDLIFFEEKKNKNFFIFDNRKPIAAVPFFIEENLDNKQLNGTYFGLSIPGPIILEEKISDKIFKKVIKIILQEIELRSTIFNLKKIKINFSDTVNIEIGTQKYFLLIDYLSSFNFSNVSFMGLRINLDNKLSEIVKYFSKGHKSDIKQNNINNFLFYNYKKKKLYFNEFCKVLKNIQTPHMYQLLYELYKKDKVYLAYYLMGKEEVFCSLFTIAGNTVEYFFSDSSFLSHHTLIYSSCIFFKNLKKIKYLNLGIVNSMNNFEYMNCKKKKNIAKFKKGFGGEKFQYTFFEKKY